MKQLYLLYLSILLTSCAATPTPTAEQIPSTTITHHHKNPMTVSFYQRNQPLNHAYKIVGQTTVLKYNQRDIKRQEAIIRDIMRNQAASLDGDAIINITSDDKIVQGTIVSYAHILI